MTQSLTLSRVSYSYPDAATSALFDVSATFPPGWTGIVGLNGCGKSTLARIACRHITPDAGNVSPHLSSAFCVQDAGCVPDALFDFTCDFAPEASLLRRTLNIADDMPWRFSELSCGEQKKIQIAVALWMNPDVLVVDEPTNHIDAVCRAEIQRALAKYCGIGLLISHDRDMLDALVRRCLCFEGGRAIMRPGTYTEAREQAAIEAQTATRTRENARAEVRKLAAEQQKRRQLADRTAARRSGKNLDARDSDGRAKLGLAIYTGQDGKAGKLAARMDARVETASERLASMHVDKRYEGNLWLSSAPSRRKVLLQLDEQAIPCGPNHKLLVPRLFLGNTDHLGIVGPNGAGKSTLLRHMMHQLAGESAASGRDPFPESGNAAANSGNSAPENARAASSSESGALDSASAARESVLNNATPPMRSVRCEVLGKTRTLFVGQEVPPKQAQRLLANIKRMPSGQRGRLLSIVAQLDSDPKRILSGNDVSPGELRKLALAQGILSEPELIVLDEPTNHLDIHSTEALEKALSAFPGALVLVSHDATFLRATSSAILRLSPENGATTCTIEPLPRE